MLAGRYTSAIAVMVVMVLFETPVVRSNNGVPEMPEPPTEFATAVDVRNYLSTLRHYYSVISRPRFGKRAGDYSNGREIDDSQEVNSFAQTRSRTNVRDEMEESLTGLEMKYPVWLISREVKDTRGVEHPSTYDPNIYRSSQRRYKNRKGRTLRDETEEADMGGLQLDTDADTDGADINEERRGAEHPGQYKNWMDRASGRTQKKDSSLYMLLAGRKAGAGEDRDSGGSGRFRHLTKFEQLNLENLCAVINKDDIEFSLFPSKFAWRLRMKSSIVEQAQAILQQICDWVDPDRARSI